MIFHADDKAKMVEDHLTYDEFDQYPSLEKNPVMLRREMSQRSHS